MTFGLRLILCASGLAATLLPLAAQRTTHGLQVLYDFGSADGDLVKDRTTRPAPSRFPQLRSPPFGVLSFAPLWIRSMGRKS